MIDATVKLGNNIFEDTTAVLTIDGREVFRLRERSNDQLVADFEIRDAANQLLVKVASNNVVFAQPGLQVRNGPTYSEVVDTHKGEILVRAEEVSLRYIELTGTFRFREPRIVATPTELRVGGVVLARNQFFGGSGIFIVGDRIMI